MKKEIQFLIGFILTLNFMFGQKQTAKFVNEFIRDKDTLAIYEQFIYDDTLRIIKHQYYFITQNDILVKSFYPIKYRHNKNKFRTWRKKLDELHFDFISECIILNSRLNAFSKLETMMRNTKRHNSSCKELGKSSISIDKKTYSSKMCTCGQAVYLLFKFKTQCPRPELEGRAIY